MNQKDPLPQIELNDHHGTRCAGQIAATANNGVCGVGVAYESKVSGIRMLSLPVSSEQEANAILYENQKNHIYSCSWGPADNGIVMDGPDKLVTSAFVEGISNGREGKGNIFVFPSGNGYNTDNCNFDGYANSVFTLTIGALGYDLKIPSYAEECVAKLGVAFSSNDEKKITTTDVQDKCTDQHGGTSAAAPLASGIFALILSNRPDLGWRDLMYLIVEFAVKINSDDGSWIQNGAKKLYSSNYGFGMLDAFILVEASKSWNKVGPFVVASSRAKFVEENIPSGVGLSSSIQISTETVSNLKMLEQVTVKINLKHDSRGDIEIYLESPSGTLIQLATQRPNEKSVDGYRNWSLMTVAYWGEDPVGEWKLIVSDNVNPNLTGRLISWSLAFWGEGLQNTDSETFIESYFAKHEEEFVKVENQFFFVVGIVSFVLFPVVLTIFAVLHRKKIRYSKMEPDLFEMIDEDIEKDLEDEK